MSYQSAVLALLRSFAIGLAIGFVCGKLFYWFIDRPDSSPAKK